MIKLAIIFNRRKLSGWLTRLFTGCYAYHCAWVDAERGLMYDMHLLRRRRSWPHYPDAQVELFDPPVPVSREYLEARLTGDDTVYGALDYCLFALRPFYHLLGKSTRNARGVICSEMIYEDLCSNGWAVEFAEVPSPCDLYRWLRRG